MNHTAQPHRSPIREDEIDHFQKLILDLYQCCQARIQRQSESFSLPDAELRCLRLFEAGSGLTAKAIADRMGVVKSRITKIIDGLLTKGLIRRIQDPEDSRVWRLSLTQEGRAKLRRINQSLAIANAKILSQMTPAQRGSLLDHLEILSTAMQRVK